MSAKRRKPCAPGCHDFEWRDGYVYPKCRTCDEPKWRREVGPDDLPPDQHNGYPYGLSDLPNAAEHGNPLDWTRRGAKNALAYLTDPLLIEAGWRVAHDACSSWSLSNDLSAAHPYMSCACYADAG